MADSKLIPVAGIGIGSLFVYSALKNKKILSATQQAIQGKNPKFAQSNPTLLQGANTSGNLNNVSGGEVPVAGSSERAWILALLLSIAAPPTTANINSLIAWGQHETVWPGGPDKGGTYNLFNTTYSMPGATDYNSIGVKNYPNAAVGVAATAATLLSGYPEIVSALRSGDGLCGNPNIAGDLSKWSGGGYSEVC